MKRFVLLMALVFSSISYAAEFGKIHEISGPAYILDAAENEAALHVGEEIYVGQTITTGENGELHITSTDGGLIALRPNTTFRVDEYVAESAPTDKIHMSLLKGSLRSVTGWIPKHNPGAYRVSTLTATIGVRGTDHEVTIVEEGEEDAGIHNAVHQGTTVFRNSAGEVHVPAGHFAFAPHSGVTKPSLLEKKPKFHAKKLLYKIEHKLEKRKLELEERLEEMHNKWVKKLKRVEKAI